MVALAVEIAVAKTNKYANRESGDTVELLERPGGGFSVVVVDGQGSGGAAKALSLLLTSKAVALLKEGVRDGAAARAVHDVLFAYHQGRVSASLDILSVDLKTRSVVATRNGETPMVVYDAAGWRSVACAAGPIGWYHFTRPSVTHLRVEPGLLLCAYTDGIVHAGARAGSAEFDVRTFAEERVRPNCPPADIAGTILREAVRRDDGRAGDDMTVVVLALREHDQSPLVRTLDLYAPLP